MTLPSPPRSPLLLTPGPLTTTGRTRAALGRDWGSRDPAFVALTTELRERLVALIDGAALDDGDAFVCVPMQGSGTFGVEATIGTLVPPDGKLLVAVNGAYGRRMVQIAQTMGRAVVAQVDPEEQPTDVAALEATLRADPAITHVAAVHCETTTGLLNPIEAIAEVVQRAGRRLLIDAMSAFGALPLSARTLRFDAVMASSNKCLEGVPGMAFTLARRSALQACAGQAHSLALDLHAQHERFEKDGQWRFTPPTHVVAAFVEALRQHDVEGGVAGRGARYRDNGQTLVDGMRRLGFRTLLPDAVQAPIIFTFHEPDDPAWSFTAFYDALAARGFAIYPGKLTEVATFRVGCIGALQRADLQAFVEAVAEVLAAQGLTQAA